MLIMIIADDEPVIIRGIRKLLDWESLGIRIAGEYENGTDAMEGILSCRPDFALLDISMPGMTGIDILKNIRRLNLTVKVIFISGFQDFEYARNALKYGAAAYLLKPVIREELLNAIEECAKNLLPGEKESDSETGRLAGQSQKRAKNLLPGEKESDSETGRLVGQSQKREKNLLPGEKESDSETGRLAGQRPEREKGILTEEKKKEEADKAVFPQPIYLLATATALDLAGRREAEKRLILFSAESFLERQMEEKKYGMTVRNGKELFLIFKAASEEKAMAALRALKADAEAEHHLHLGFAVSAPLSSLEQLTEGCEACRNLSRWFYFSEELPTDLIREKSPLFGQTVGTAELAKIRETILSALISRNKDQLDRSWKWFCRSLCIAADGRKEDADYYFCSFLRRIGEEAETLGVRIDHPDMKQILEKARKFSSFAEEKKFFYGYLIRFYEEIAGQMTDSGKKEILQARDYIEKHYSEDLTLEILAGEIHMNPFYFSNFFKKQTGENFKSYVSRIRLENAMPLLLRSELKLYEIAAEVGFSDVRAFNDAFQKTYKETPGAYRKRVTGKA